jgi:hypothetical protein
MVTLSILRKRGKCQKLFDLLCGGCCPNRGEGAENEDDDQIRR